MALTDRPSSERPREKWLERGPDALSDSELVAILLRTGLPGQDAIALAHQLITQFGGLYGLLSAPHQALGKTLGLGPAKSRDFASSLGPWLVTRDELELYTDDDGRLSLILAARVTGIERSRATSSNHYYPFPELIAHASRDVQLYPGDLIGSGVVVGGTLFEQTRGFGPWLARGDRVELEVTGLGVLQNHVA